MNKQQIFIGNIRKCTKFEEISIFNSKESIKEIFKNSKHFTEIIEEDELYKENAILIKTNTGDFIDLDQLNSILYSLYIEKILQGTEIMFFDIMMPTFPKYSNGLFVDPQSLRSYFPEDLENNSKISIKQLKKEIKSKKRNLLTR